MYPALLLVQIITERNNASSLEHNISDHILKDVLYFAESDDICILYAYRIHSTGFLVNA